MIKPEDKNLVLEYIKSNYMDSDDSWIKDTVESFVKRTKELSIDDFLWEAGRLFGNIKCYKAQRSVSNWSSWQAGWSELNDILGYKYHD